MTCPIEICTIGGKVFTLKARDDWSVWQLKCAVEKPTGTHPSLQKLVCNNGNILLDGPLCDFCPLTAEGAKLFLVKMPKSKEDLAWFQKWCSEAPEWLKRLAEEAMDDTGMTNFRRAVVANADQASPFFKVPRGWKGTSDSCHPHPTRVIGHAQEAKSQPAPLSLMKTGGEVLLAVQRSKLDFAFLDICGKEVTLTCNPTRAAGTELKATLTAVSAAIAEEPRVMLDPLSKGEFMTEEEVVELVLPIVAQHAGMYERLPEDLAENQDILFAALQGDPELRAEFLRSADRASIRKWREWQWPTASGQYRCKWSKRCRDDW